MTLHLTISAPAKVAPADTRWLKRHLLQTLQLLRIRTAEWSITIVNDPEMTTLHARTMNLPTTTDVLTFDLRDPPPQSPPSATARANMRTKRIQRADQEGTEVELDTVLCLDEAARRAKELAHPCREELLLYAIHSLLHVQGYNDLQRSDAATMHRREDTLLIALGIGPRYAPSHQKPKISNQKSKGTRS
jgi:probable rRNA maturation factor